MPLYLTQFAYTPEAWGGAGPGARGPDRRGRRGVRADTAAGCASSSTASATTTAWCWSRRPDETAVAAVLIGAVAAGHLEGDETTVLLRRRRRRRRCGGPARSATRTRRGRRLSVSRRFGDPPPSGRTASRTGIDGFRIAADGSSGCGPRSTPRADGARDLGARMRVPTVGPSAAARRRGRGGRAPGHARAEHDRGGRRSGTRKRPAARDPGDAGARAERRRAHAGAAGDARPRGGNRLAHDRRSCSATPRTRRSPRGRSNWGDLRHRFRQLLRLRRPPGPWRGALREREQGPPAGAGPKHRQRARALRRADRSGRAAAAPRRRQGARPDRRFPRRRPLRLPLPRRRAGSVASLGPDGPVRTTQLANPGAACPPTRSTGASSPKAVCASSSAPPPTSPTWSRTTRGAGALEDRGIAGRFR
jgi:hypothetical protein